VTEVLLGVGAADTIRTGTNASVLRAFLGLCLGSGPNAPLRTKRPSELMQMLHILSEGCGQLLQRLSLRLSLAHLLERLPLLVGQRCVDSVSGHNASTGCLALTHVIILVSQFQLRVD